MWRAIHVVALGLPHDADRATKDAYVAFYESLKTVIPCIQCSQGYTRIVANLKPGIAEAVESGPDALFAWTVDVHNKVAEKLGHEAMTEDFVRDHYMFGDARVIQPDDKGSPSESEEAVGAGKGPGKGGASSSKSGGASGAAGASGASGAADDAPWSQETFIRHSGNPVIVYVAAVFSLGLVGAVLWYSSRVCSRK